MKGNDIKNFEINDLFQSPPFNNVKQYILKYILNILAQPPGEAGKYSSDLRLRIQFYRKMEGQLSRAGQRQPLQALVS